MHDQNRWIRGISDRGVVDPQFRHRLAIVEMEIANGKIAFHRIGIIGRAAKNRESKNNPNFSHGSIIAPIRMLTHAD
jgi:hypothetical protein